MPQLKQDKTAEPHPLITEPDAMRRLRAYNTMKRMMRWHDFGSGRETRPAA